MEAIGLLAAVLVTMLCGVTILIRNHVRSFINDNNGDDPWMH